jgi:hypothetical protein
MLDLTDNELLKANGCTPIGPLQQSDTDTTYWDPQESGTVNRVTEFSLEGEASALAQGLPVDAKVAVKYKTSTDFGAILMCDEEAVVEGYDHRDPFRAWLKQNAPTLLTNYPTVKKHGIYVATLTYSSSDIHIEVWQNPQKEITLGFKAGVTGVGSVGPSVKWMRASSSDG